VVFRDHHDCARASRVACDGRRGRPRSRARSAPWCGREHLVAVEVFRHVPRGGVPQDYARIEHERPRLASPRDARLWVQCTARTMTLFLAACALSALVPPQNAPANERILAHAPAAWCDQLAPWKEMRERELDVEIVPSRTCSLPTGRRRCSRAHQALSLRGVEDAARRLRATGRRRGHLSRALHGPRSDHRGGLRHRLLPERSLLRDLAHP
jgi:hypothetical protein